MYVCICKAVTDKQIRKSVGDGVASFHDLQTSLDVGTNCGKCTEVAQDVLDQAVLESASANSNIASPIFKTAVA